MGHSPCASLWGWSSLPPGGSAPWGTAPGPVAEPALPLFAQLGSLPMEPLGLACRCSGHLEAGQKQGGQEGTRAMNDSSRGGTRLGLPCHRCS